MFDVASDANQHVGPSGAHSLDALRRRRDADVRTLDGLTAAVDAAALRDCIVRRLAEQAPETLGHVEVAVIDGVATVFGQVRDWIEWETVLDVVRACEGVRAVDDELRIRWCD